MIGGKLLLQGKISIWAQIDLILPNILFWWNWDIFPHRAKTYSKVKDAVLINFTIFTRIFQNILNNIYPGERGCCEEITFWAHSVARYGAYTDGQVSPTVFTKTLRSTIQCQRKQEYVPSIFTKTQKSMPNIISSKRFSMLF